MIIHDVEQGSPEWRRLRMGRPTASQFHRIITPGGKPSAQAEAYMHELLAEMIVGEPLEFYKSPAMQTGQDREAEAIAFYELWTGRKVQRVGFCTDDSGRIGASPDGMVGEGLLEVKCPGPAAHVRYLLGEEAPRDYWVQLQGQLYVCAEHKWTDILCYFPAMPHAITRVERHAGFQERLGDALTDFLIALEAGRKRLEDRGWLAEQRKTSPPDETEDWLNVTDADVTAILAARRDKSDSFMASLGAQDQIKEQILEAGE